MAAAQVTLPVWGASLTKRHQPPQAYQPRTTTTNEWCGGTGDSGPP